MLKLKRLRRPYRRAVIGVLAATMVYLLACLFAMSLSGQSISRVFTPSDYLREAYGLNTTLPDGQDRRYYNDSTDMLSIRYIGVQTVAKQSGQDVTYVHLLVNGQFVSFDRAQVRFETLPGGKGQPYTTITPYPDLDPDRNGDYRALESAAIGYGTVVSQEGILNFLCLQCQNEYGPPAITNSNYWIDVLHSDDGQGPDYAALPSLVEKIAFHGNIGQSGSSTSPR